MTTVGRVVILDETENGIDEPMTIKIFNKATLIIRVDSNTGEFEIIKQKATDGKIYIRS